MMDEEDIAIILNVIVIGDASVGKTNLVSRYVKNEYSEQTKPTIGADFCTKIVNIKGKNVNIKFWDTAGQEKYRAIGKKFYKDANGVVLVYDVSCKPSYDNLNSWVVDLKEKAGKDLVVILIGNKTDLLDDKEVSTEDGKRFAQVYDYYFLETSAKENLNVTDAFDLLAEKASEKLLQKQEEQELKDFSTARSSIQHINPQAMVPKKSKCC